MFWNYISLAASALVTAVLAAYSLRTFGAAVFGLFALAITVGRLAQIVPSAFITATTRVVARESQGPPFAPPEQAKSHVAAAHVASLAAAGLTLLLSALIALSLLATGAVDALQALMLFLVGGSVAVWMSTAVLQGVATGLRSFKLLAIGTVIGAAVQLIVVISLSRSLKGAALGLGELVAVAANRAFVGVGLRNGAWWRAWSVGKSGSASFKAVFGFSGPLWVIGAATQVVSSTDIIILSFFSSASVVGLYRVGSIVPTQFVASLFRGYDTAFPILAGEPVRRAQEEAVRLLTLLFTLVAGVGCGFLFFERAYLSRLMTGHSDQFVANVIALFSMIWLVNVPVHGLALLLIARGRQQRLVPLVSMEMLANLVVTIVLVRTVGPLGAAWASLLTIFVSNAVALPYLVRRELDVSISGLVIRAGYLPAVLGFGAAGLAYLASDITRAIAPQPIKVGVLSVIFGAVLASLMVGSADRRLLRSALRGIG
jgi:O-antigen/teichoic acid export membrane protein